MTPWMTIFYIVVMLLRLGDWLSVVVVLCYVIFELEYTMIP